MEQEVLNFLRRVLPAHIRIETGEHTPVPTQVQFDEPPPDASIYDKVIWSVEFVGLPPFYDFYQNTDPFPIAR